MTRVILARHGVRGNRRVLVFRDPERQLVTVERYVGGRPRRKSWPLTREGERAAKAWAKAWYEAPARMVRERTVREIWEAYLGSPQYAKLRPRTKLLYRQRWDRFELFVKPDTPADAITLHTVDQLWHELTTLGVAPNQIRHIVAVAKIVYRWAESRELITRNRVGLWRLPEGRAARPLEIPEYTPEECERILATLRPQDGREWRFAALFLFAAEHGFRSNATLHLTWQDVDLVKGTVTMVEDWDEQGERHTRPLTWGALSALLTARYWRERLGYRGPWVFFSGQPARRDEPWSYQAANLALRRAERAAGVPHVKYRAFHGVRRTVAGNVRAETGDPVLGLFWVGDRDMKQATKYIKQRLAELQAIADARPDAGRPGQCGAD